MKRTNNYLIQAQQAKQRFLGYDQETLIRKHGLDWDEQYLYVYLLCKQYRISRTTGNLEYRAEDCWQDGNTYEEVMTLLDLLCDSREDRCISGGWQNMQSFGMQFHQNLLEDKKDPFAALLDADPGLLHRAAQALHGEKIPGGDVGYAFTLFEDLKIGLLFWHGDEEFYPRVRYLWDANARQYIRYETMYFATSLLRQSITSGGAAASRR